MRSNCKSIWKSKNIERQLLLLFKALIVFSSIGIVYGGVVRREIVDKLNSDNSNGSGSGSSSSSSSGSSSVGHNDDIVIDSDAIVTKNVTFQSLHPNISVTTSNDELSLLSSSILAVTTTTTAATATTTTQLPTAIATAGSAAAAAVTDLSTLSLARITKNDIKKPQTTLAQNDSESNTNTDDILNSQALPTEVRIESTTTTASTTTIPNPTESQQQQLRITTIRDSSISEHLQSRKGKTIIHPLDPLIPVESTSTSLNGSGGVITTTTIKPTEFEYITGISSTNNNRSIKTAGESYVGGDSNNTNSNNTNSISSNSNVVAQIQKIETATVVSEDPDKIRNVKEENLYSSSKVNNIHRNQSLEITTENIKRLNQEQDKDTKISTKLSNSNHSNGFNEKQQTDSSLITSTEFLDISDINFDFTTTIDNLQKDPEDSLLQTTLPTYDSFFSNHHDRSEDNTDDNNDNDSDEEGTTISDIDDFNTGEFLKSEIDTNIKNKTIVKVATETGKEIDRASAVISTATNQANKTKQIINLNSSETTNYDDISVNEIKKSNSSEIIGHISSTTIISNTNTSNNASKSGMKRDSKFIKGEANMTIPDVAEVWALASMKNIKKDVIKNGNLVNAVAAINSANTTSQENLQSEKVKLGRNDTTAKILVDWSQIMKGVEIEEENTGINSGIDVDRSNNSSRNSSSSNNLTNSANSVENALESGGIKNDLGKLIEQLQQQKQTSIVGIEKNNASSTAKESVTPFTPTKFTVKVEKENNETLQQIKVVPPPSSVIGQDDQEKQKEKSDIIAVPAIHKNQIEDLEQQFNSKENSKNLNEKEQQNIVIDTTITSTTTSPNLNKSMSTDTSTTTTTTANYLVTTEAIQQVTKTTAVTTDKTLLLSTRDHLSSTSSDSSPKKVNNIKTGVTRKGTSNYKEILTTLSSLLSTTEAIRSQTEHNYPTTTYPTYEDTTVYNNLEPIIKIGPTEHELSLFSSLPSTETNLIAATTIRSSRTSSTTPNLNRKFSTTIHPTSPIKAVTKESTNHPTFSKSESEGNDNTFATGPENSIESNTIDRVPSHTTPSDQNLPDVKVASTTTVKINVFPVDTNSVEHLMHNSTTTHKTVPTKAEQEYSVYNVPKFIDSTTNYPSPTFQHPTTHVPPHLGGPSMPDDPNMPQETDYNVIIAISVSVVGIIALILLVGFLYVMRKRQKQLTYGQRCRPVSLDAYSLDNVSVYNSVRRKGALRASKRSYGNVAFDDPSLKHNVLNVQELVKFVEKKSIIYEEFKDVPQIIARPDEVPAGCEDKNRYANVIPLPETRVILQRQNDDEKTEYINANYVRGPKDPPNYYIACQAPLESTVADFWRMIWEQNSRVIIMATDLIENGIEKCTEYLPTSIALDNHVIFGDYQITLKSREVKEKYAVSILHLKNMVTNVWREITHFWYKWPETGVPSDEAGVIAMLLEARSSLKASPIDETDDDNVKSSNGNDVENNDGNETSTDGRGDDVTKKKNGNLKNSGEAITTNGSVEKLIKSPSQKTQGPLTVHCSPGTGRTGTIIACDIVLRSLETPKRSVDIPQIVYYVRRGRASSVQTKEQYEFIYRVANMYASKISGPINDN